MRILYQPQLSMRSYGSPPRWLTSSDAHLTKLKAYVAALPAQWSWHVLMPPTGQRSGAALAVDGREVIEHPVPFTENVHQERFNFPLRELGAVYRSVWPELLICEIPEHVAGWRAVQQAAGKTCPIVASVEHIEFYAETGAAAAGSRSFLRQLEGALAADAVAFPLAGMRDEFCQQAERVAPGQAEGIGERAAIWPGLFSAREVDAYRAEGLALHADGQSPVVFLISRISDPTRTRYAEIIAGSNLLDDAGIAHRLWIANPNEAGDWAALAAGASAYEDHPYGRRTLAREEYLRLLWAADIVPIMYDLSRIYSVGACEAAAAGNAVLTAPQRYRGPRLTVCEPEPVAIAAALNTLLGEAARLGDREEMLSMHGIEANCEPVLATLAQVTG